MAWPGKGALGLQTAAHLGGEAALGGQVDDKHRLALEGVHVEALAVDVLQREGQEGQRAGLRVITETASVHGATGDRQAFDRWTSKNPALQPSTELPHS